MNALKRVFMDGRHNGRPRRDHLFPISGYIATVVSVSPASRVLAPGNPPDAPNI
jgi:hypothetical protein